ncbi:hypothetical protein PLCT2_02714 [Planctomycetaceae bacterium]|nr:hypothetical protein PLCT2_02714 [Planctomycetaceae bacterium]
MAQMTQITAKAFATEDTESTENSKCIGFRGNGYSPACERGVFFVPDYNCTPPLQAGLWDSARVCRKTKPQSSSILTILPILPILQMRSTQPGAL